MSWQIVWEIVLCAGIGVFTLASLVVAIKGYGNIRNLLNDLGKGGSGGRAGQRTSSTDQSGSDLGN